MALLIYFTILFFIFNFRRPATPGLLLLMIYGLSLGCGLFINHDFAVNSTFEVFNIIFLGAMLTLMILPWNKFDYASSIGEPDPNKVRKLTLVLLVVNGVAFVIFSVICLWAFSEVTDFSRFKNGGESGAFIDQLPLIDTALSHSLFLLATYLQSSSCFLVPLHFHYLSKKRYALAIICLLFSANSVLAGLTTFSRSAFLGYSFIYISTFPLFYKNMQGKLRRVLLASAVGLVCLGLVPFAHITANRFSDVVSYKNAASDQTLINSPEVYSLFDYAGQWYKNSNDVMATYSFDTLNGGISFTFVLTVADKLRLIDYPPEQIERQLYALWGDHSDKFNGLIANLLFDFGYVGTSIFVLFYGLILWRLKPVNGELSFAKVLMVAVMFVLPASGIFNSELKNANYDTLILYSIIVYVYMSHKTVRSKVPEVQPQRELRDFRQRLLTHWPEPAKRDHVLDA
jgi:hypothetical protein